MANVVIRTIGVSGRAQGQHETFGISLRYGIGID